MTRKSRILVVEDEGIVAKDIQHTLIGLGYEVTSLAATGERAVELAMTTEPDLVLMDIMLRGELDGVTAATRIRNSLKIPIVFLTAYSDPDTLERAKCVEPFGYIIKPFQDRELYTVIEMALHKRKIERELEESQELLRKLLESEQQARREAQEANRAKDIFLATLSHELKTPLTTVLTWAQLLKHRSFEESQIKRAAEIIERNARAQVLLINDLLDISRIVMGKLAIEIQETPLAPLLHAAQESIKTAAEAKAISVGLSVSVSRDQVAADPVRLQQILWNLLNNSAKFTPAGGEIRISARDAFLSGNPALPAVEIAISDSGEGIDPDFLSEVFNRFSQADNSMNRKHGGLGLGLAIVKGLVDIQGGEVEAESPGRGKGSTFKVRLPVARIHLEESPA
jgi:signal transduction histidine kinase